MLDSLIVCSYILAEKQYTIFAFECFLIDNEKLDKVLVSFIIKESGILYIFDKNSFAFDMQNTKDEAS